MSGALVNTGIPSTLVPLFYATFSNANAGAGTQPQRILLIGGTLNAMPLTPVFLEAGTSALQSQQYAQALFGVGSELADMVFGVRQNDPQTEMWALPIPDPSGGVVATATLAMTGTTTAAGTLPIYVNGVAYQVGYTSGMTAAQLATAIVTATPNNLSVTVAANTGTVTYTTRHKGVMANGNDLRVAYLGPQGQEITPPGITITVTNFTAGSGTPDLTGVAAALGTAPYDFIISGFNDTTSLTALVALMNDSAGRWSPYVQDWGHVFAGIQASASTLASGPGQNSQHLTVWCCTNSPNPPWMLAAACTGACTQSIQSLPNLPLQFSPIEGLLAPQYGDRYSESTQNTLLGVGFAQPYFTRSGNAFVLRAVTTYTTNALGVTDTSYQDVETLFALMAITRQLKAMVTQRYARVLLVDDGTPIGFGIPAVSPGVVKSDLVAEYATMETLGWVEDADLFEKGLFVARNTIDPSRLDVLLDPHIVSGLRVFAMLDRFVLRPGVA